MNRFIITASLLLLITLISFIPHEGKLKYSQKPTIIQDDPQAQITITAYRDTLSNDSLYKAKSKENIPLHYFKHITTEVCFDNECRLLTITVYWNITGRYLGFELPEGEFLSKRDHEPFFNDEYERLNDLLADPNLPLGGISFEKLIEMPPFDNDSVDGITGATTLAVSQMVVKGAAYTTYTLWNIVHGATKDFVMRLTEKELSPNLMELILQSPDINDRVWVLNRIDQKTILTPKLAATLLEIISGNDFYLAYSTLNALEASHLNSDTLQIALFSIYKKADYSIKRMIIEKFMEVPYLSPKLVINSRKLLGKLNGKQLGDMLKLYTKHSVNDLETYKTVAEILKNDNRFISRQAYKFLKEANISDGEIEALLDDYERKE